MLYKYETHLHCCQCSYCAGSTSTELVLAYQRAGYAGFVLTDHFIYGNTCVDRTLPWKPRMERYYNAYLEAKELGDRLDFDVIFGLEHSYGDGKEVLLYGIDLGFLLDNPDIPRLTLDQIVDRVHRAGGLVIQAHPYRERGYIDSRVPPRADIVDGIEIYNAGNSPEENLPALELARKGDYIITSGGDVHSSRSIDIGMAGVVLDNRVHDGKTFVRALKEKNHGLLVQGRILSAVTGDDLSI